MTHEELRGHYELYALGAAREPERSEIRDHLDRGCEVCMTEMKRARELAALLGTATDRAAPSPKLRRRILAAAGVEERRFGLAPFLAAATLLCLFAAVYFSGRERQYADESLLLRERVRRQTIELTRLNEAFTILSSPGTTQTAFGPAPRGKVYVNPAQGVLLVASNLPPAPAGKVYEMWVTPKGGKPVPAGLFQSERSGAAMHLRSGAVVPNAEAVAVTLEPDGGSPQPTSTPVLAATLQ